MSDLYANNNGWREDKRRIGKLEPRKLIDIGILGVENARYGGYDEEVELDGPRCSVWERQVDLGLGV